MENFRILSYEEESKLTSNELIAYYKSLKQYLLNYKNNILKNSYTNGCEELHPLVRKIIDRIKNYDLTITGQENIPNSPVIYVSTHQDFYDHFNLILGVPEHTIILNNGRIALWMKILLNFNGIVYVDRNDSQSKFNSKIELMKYLAKGKSIAIFPEATYNCSPNKFHLRLYSGAVDIARKMQIPIIPIVQEYDYDPLITSYKCVKSCELRFGTPVYVKYDDDISIKKEELSEQLATMRWDLIEQKGLYSRESITEQEYINYILSRRDSYQKAKVKESDELKALKGYGEEIYLFSYINAIDFDSDGHLLVPQEVRKLDSINSLHINGCFNKDGNYLDFDKLLTLSRTVRSKRG